jgi:hypothetical protein
MVKRHTTLPFTFFCLTENPSGISNPVVVLPLPSNQKLFGWWWKPYAFKEGLIPSGNVNMFIDLDMVIVNNIDKLFTYRPTEFIGLEDVGRVFKSKQTKLGSAVLRWDTNTNTDIWSNLENDLLLSTKFRGDQDYLWFYYKDRIKFFPREWIQSYKWEVRDRSELSRIGNRWQFRNTRNPDINLDTSILAFHGSPDPHEVMDPIIIDNWR